MKNLRRSMIIVSTILLALLLSVTCFAASSGGSTINNLQQGETEKIEEHIEKYMDKGKIPGISVVIVKGDETIYQKGVGYADVESKKVVTSKTLFELGSTSKAFTGLGILKLEKEGLIDINEPITKYIPWLKMKFEGVETPVTVEQFLHQTSGVPFKTIDSIPMSDKDKALEETVKNLVGIELDTYPGERFQYATINYDVLGYVIEKVTGKSYEEYMNENVIKDLGLSNTYLDTSNLPLEEMSVGYKINFLKPREYKAPVYRGNKPAGYIISNGEDMAKWLKIHLGTYSNYTFDKDLIEKSHIANRRVAPLRDNSSYSDGWFVYQDGGGEIAHGGNNPNFSSFIIFRPEEKIGVAILSNTNSSYVELMGQGLIDLMQNKEFNPPDITDLNKSIDRASSIALFILIPLCVLLVAFILIAIKQSIMKERVFQYKGIKSILILLFSAVFMVFLTYCIYWVPYILYNGVSWSFVFIWLPGTIKIAVYLLTIFVWLLYLYAVFVNFFKIEKDKSLFLLGILGTISGLGNSLIIFTINMAVVSDNDLKLKLLVYFALGIIFYVYGQRLVRTRLIEVTNNIVYEKRMDLVTKLLKTSYDDFETIESGRIQATLSNDTEVISNFANILINGVTSFITLIFCFLYLGFINKDALLFSVVIILVISTLYYFVGRYANRIGEQARDIQNKFFRFITDFINGFKELSLNENKKNEFKQDMEESCNNFRIKRGKAALAFANMFVVGELLFSLAIGAVVFGFPLIFKNIQSGTLGSYVFVLLYMTGPVNGLLHAIPNIINVRISWKRINDLLKQILSIKSEELDEKYLELDKNIKLTLKEVEYEYKNSEDNKFKVGPIDYEFKSGEIVFVTGGNGSGKSTLAKLITGLYTPSKGKITINNKDLSKHSLSQYYSTIFSDFYLFEKLYGVNYKDKEKDIKEYLEVLQMDKKVQIENGRFSTIKLSTGQKKRLALLISYLEDKPIYLFDEWAADQDPEFRKFFYNTLLPDLKKREKCVIAITHDEHYFELADKIIKMDMGMAL